VAHLATVFSDSDAENSVAATCFFFDFLEDLVFFFVVFEFLG